MATTITIEVARNEDGSINVNETLFTAENSLIELGQQEETQGAAISQYVHAVFDEHLGKHLTIPYLQATVMSKMLEDNPGEAVKIRVNYKEWQDAVRTFVRTSNEFDVAKGKGGGAFRLRDVPPKEDKKNGK